MYVAGHIVVVIIRAQVGLEGGPIFLQFRFSGSTFVLNGILVHGGIEAFFQPAGSALISMGLVNRTTPFEVALSFASVHPVSMDASLKETRATYKKKYWSLKSHFFEIKGQKLSCLPSHE